MIFDTKGIDCIDQGIMSHRRFWGSEHELRVLDQLLEELAELIVEICHRKRGENSRLSLFGEICDVLLCLEFLGRINNFTAEQVRAQVSTLAVSLSDKLAGELRLRQKPGGSVK